MATCRYHTGLDEIFLPGFEPPAGRVAQAWSGQTADDEVSPLGHMSLLTIGAFGLLSNARSVARWGCALFGGEVLGRANVLVIL